MNIADEDLEKHVITDIESRCIRFADPNDNNLSFQVLWSPMCVQMFGDAGELTITHYHSLDTFDSAMHWISSSNQNYLLEKSGEEKVFSYEDTKEDIAEFILDIYNEYDEGDSYQTYKENMNDLIDLYNEIEYLDRSGENPNNISKAIYDCRFNLDDYYGSSGWSRNSLRRLLYLQHAATEYIKTKEIK